MNDEAANSSSEGQTRRRGTPRHVAPDSGATWSFVYIFFTNNIPFDAPNRSEPCPRS